MTRLFIRRTDSTMNKKSKKKVRDVSFITEELSLLHYVTLMMIVSKMFYMEMSWFVVFIPLYVYIGLMIVVIVTHGSESLRRKKYNTDAKQ